MLSPLHGKGPNICFLKKRKSHFPSWSYANVANHIMYISTILIVYTNIVDGNIIGIAKSRRQCIAILYAPLRNIQSCQSNNVSFTNRKRAFLYKKSLVKLYIFDLLKRENDIMGCETCTHYSVNKVMGTYGSLS